MHRAESPAVLLPDPRCVIRNGAASTHARLPLLPPEVRVLYCDRRMMTKILLVGLGSFIGGVLRYGLAGLVYRSLGGPWFPWGTLAVNAAGSFVIGFLAGSGGVWMPLSGDMRLFLFTGILGGFTTFSAFALETFVLTQEGQQGAAVINIALQLLLGLAAVWFGHAIGHGLARAGA